MAITEETAEGFQTLAENKAVAEILVRLKPDAAATLLCHLASLVIAKEDPKPRTADWWALRMSRGDGN